MNLLKSEQFKLLTVTGKDQPGITAELLTRLEIMDVAILDMGQAVTHGQLALSLVIENHLKPSQEESLTEFKQYCKKHKLQLEMREVEDQSIGRASEQQNFILTLISPQRIPLKYLKELSCFLRDSMINIHSIDNIKPDAFCSLELLLNIPSQTAPHYIKENLMKIGHRYNIDMALVSKKIFRNNKRVVVFDMDSTLIQQEVINLLGKKVGQEEKMADITHMAMTGKLDFKEALRERVSMLKGLTKKQMESVFQEIILTEGITKLIKDLKSNGYKLALVTGGFSFFAEKYKEQLGLDYLYSNHLEIKDGALTGRITGEIIDAQGKANCLMEIASKEAIPVDQIIAIGDGANDIPMLSLAGLGIAFNAKERVNLTADSQLKFGPISSISYFLGL